MVGRYKCSILSEKLNLMFEGIINCQRTIKTFVFEREESHQSVIVEQEVDLSHTFANLKYLFNTHSPTQTYKVSLYDPDSNRFVSLSSLNAENGYIHKQYLQPSIILIRYKKKYNYGGDSDSVDSSLEPNTPQEKKEEGRSKERTIAEVIELVKRWRNLHLYGHKTLNRRLNLQDAAKLVGISKKSLDDYYCQLRLGEFHHFDFAGNLQQKMGVLRSFVKDHKDGKTEQKKRKQNAKHPKNLRVIQQFQLATKTIVISKEDEQQESMRQMSEMPDRQMLGEQSFHQGDPPEAELQENSNHVYEQLFQIQHDFFKGFELVLNEVADPYEELRDFRKKDFDEEGDSFLYF